MFLFCVFLDIWELCGKLWLFGVWLWGRNVLLGMFVILVLCKLLWLDMDCGGWVVLVFVWEGLFLILLEWLFWYCGVEGDFVILWCNGLEDVFGDFVFLGEVLGDGKLEDNKLLLLLFLGGGGEFRFIVVVLFWWLLFCDCWFMVEVIDKWWGLWI